MDKIALIKDLEAAQSRIAELEQNQKDLHQRFTRWWSETPEASFDEWMEDPFTHWTCEEDAAWQAWQHLFEEVIFDMRERISDLEGALRDAQSLSIAWAARYQRMHEMPEFHPVHAAIIGRCKSLLQEES